MNPAATMTLPLFDHLRDVAERVAAASRVFLFLDFDGTLAPIVDDPSAAQMPQETWQSLVTLSQNARFAVAIVSGRSIADLQTRVRLPHLIYAGDHGFAIQGPGLSFMEPAAAAHIALLAQLVRQLELRLLSIHGVRVENKGLTASIHFRAARVPDRQEIYRIAAQTVAASGEAFRLFQGLSALDIRPAVDWNKGAAVQWILAAAGETSALPIYLGDDASDEDAFAVLQSGITVRVGRLGATAANYGVESQEAVGQFLTWLIESEHNPPGPTASPKGT
jgi:trehalose 6-phosphate phosphatase